MAAPAIGRRLRWAPPPSSSLEWSHPLANGLVGSGMGSTAYFMRGSRIPTSTPSVPRSIVGTVNGPGLGSSAATTDGGWAWTVPALGSTMTLLVFVQCPTANSRDSAAICWGNFNGTSGFMLGVGAANSTGPNMRGLDSAVAHRTTTYPITQTGWRCIAASCTSGGTGVYYADGTQVYSTSSSFNTGGTFLAIGAEGASARAFDGQIGAWAAWSRILTATEHALVACDPFAMFRF